MRTARLLLTLLPASLLLCGIATAAPALDAAGKCRDHGKFVTQSLCETAAPKGKCRDIKTKKFAKCSAAGTEPVPSAAAAAPK